MIPRIGFHSVIESPDSVRRVTPPTTTIAKTKKATKRSERPSARGCGDDETGRANMMKGPMALRPRRFNFGPVQTKEPQQKASTGDELALDSRKHVRSS